MALCISGGDAGQASISSTAWPLACPSGEAAFGPCSPPLAAARSSCGRDPAARLAAGSLAVPFAALRASVSRRRCARWGPAASGAIAASPEGRIECPPPTRRKPCCRSRVLTGGFGARARAPAPRELDARAVKRGGGAKTAQRAEADGAGACGSRAGVPRWGVDAPARAQRAAGDSEGRRGTPCSVARAGGSEGGARCAARATRHSPRAKEEASRSERGRQIPPAAGGRKLTQRSYR